MQRTRRVVAALSAPLLAACLLVAASSSDSSIVASANQRRPNIVMVLTDDLSTDLVRYMPHVQALQSAGMTFTNYTVTNSLCCPSRSSILTGRYPHNTGVFANEGPNGGFGAFQMHGDDRLTFALALQRAGYRTAIMGKYLNGYSPGSASGYRSPTQVGWPGTPAPGGNYVAPGWTTWAVAGKGYGEYDYNLNFNHRILHFGVAPHDYGVRTLDRLGRHFITDSAAADKPFLLELSTFAPHPPYTPAYGDRDLFPSLRAPRTPAWNTTPSAAPSWLAGHRPLTRPEISRIDRAYRLRAEAVQSVDRAVGHLLDQLRTSGQLSNTVFMFTSDNGYHLGQYRMVAGKMSAFDTDIKVPLIVAGPGIPAGRVNGAVVESIDLAPTFEQLAGLPPAPGRDGASLVGLLHGRKAADWRTLALVEHHGQDFTQFPGDPDVEPGSERNIPSYNAMRSAQFTYVHYQNGQREYYDRTVDPYELDNIAGTLSAEQLSTLDEWLAALTNCHGAAECWAAGRAGQPLPATG
ncbi:MAG TPA: sulfatase [Jatrophihabitans sp.]|jgi:arylsulfatase A-like enzyme|nr:sulfatase [Jatrophihabitans sp.]